MTNSADPDQLASSEANWSGSSLFAKAGYILVQQDKGCLMAAGKRLLALHHSADYILFPLGSFSPFRGYFEYLMQLKPELRDVQYTLAATLMFMKRL